MQRRDYRLRVGESIRLSVHGPRPTRRLHDRAVSGAAEVDRDEAGVLDQAADQSLRRLLVAAQPLDDATVAFASRGLGLEAGGERVERLRQLELVSRAGEPARNPATDAACADDPDSHRVLLYPAAMRANVSSLTLRTGGSVLCW